MIKDFRYIIKRIIIGVGIALVLSFLRGNLVLGVSALEVNATPRQILVATPDVYSFTPTLHYWNNQNVYSFPNNTSTDWGSGTSVYFTYPQNAGATYCDYANNQSTLYGRVYNASTANIGSTVVQYEDVTSGGYHRCSYEQHGNYIDFICNNFPSNHGFNIQLGNAGPGMWGITQVLSFTCIQSGEDISSSINANQNENSQKIINNNNMNTDRIIDSNYNNMKTIDDTLKNDDISESEDTITDFFNDFDSGSTGNLTDIISLPLNFLNNLNNACTPLVLPLPYLNQDLTIPCISTYLAQFVPSTLINLIKLLINGFLCYRIISSFIVYINQLKDPNNNDLEVMDL